jgi:hypothetical protein
MSMKPALVLAMACATPLWGQAQMTGMNIKPGLWENTTKMSGSPEMEAAMAEMQKQLAAMPPDQRRAMQDMMARQGVQMGAGPGGAMTTRICLTREMIQSDDWAKGERGDCSHGPVQKSGNTWRMTFSCPKPPTQGEAVTTIVSDSAYTSRITMNSTENGKPVRQVIDNSSRWLGADCGNVRPIQTAPGGAARPPAR